VSFPKNIRKMKSSSLYLQARDAAPDFAGAFQSSIAHRLAKRTKKRSRNAPWSADGIGGVMRPFS
jgi:hypothetical protein